MIVTTFVIRKKITDEVWSSLQPQGRFKKIKTTKNSFSSGYKFSTSKTRRHDHGKEIGHKEKKTKQSEVRERNIVTE